MKNQLSGASIRPPKKAPGTKQAQKSQYPEQSEATIKLSAAQSYVNYLKYKQEFEEPDNAPWIFSWLLMAASGCFIGIVLSFGFAWLCGWIP